MSERRLAVAAALALTLASTSPGLDPAAAQAPPAAPAPFVPPKSTYVPPKTPWGDPDIQGIYDYQSSIPIERPVALGTKATYTDAEVAERKTAEARRAARDNPNRAYNDFWTEHHPIEDNRTSLLVDPPNGRFPPLTPAGEKRRQEILATGYDGTTWDSIEDIHPLTRCIAAQTPSGPFRYNGGVYIMQTPGWVMLVRERLDTRMIALDGRPHVGQSIRQWNGDSRGHWEGNVLVVDTTNFTDEQKGSTQFAGHIVGPGHPFGNFHLTERFVPIGAKRLHVYATVEDPTTWTRPWTIMIPYEIQPGYQIYEYACNEGNLSVGNGLRGQRVQEAEAAAKGKK